MNMAKRASRRTYQGGSTTDIIFGILVVGLLACGLWWIIKTVGQAGQQYSKALINTSDSAVTMKCQMNLRTIWQNLQIHSISEGQFPDSAQGFKRVCGDLRLMHCPDPNGGDYVYIPPGRLDDEAVRILVYEPNAVHDGQCNALLSNGEIGQIPPEQLKALLKQMPR